MLVDSKNSQLLVTLCLQNSEVFASPLQVCGPLDSEAMVMGVLDQSFDVLVLRYGVQKRIYCKVRLVMLTFVLHKRHHDHLHHCALRPDSHDSVGTISFHFSLSQASAHSAIRRWGRSLS